jgi:hypothetical protein
VALAAGHWRQQRHHDQGCCYIMIGLLLLRLVIRGGSDNCSRRRGIGSGCASAAGCCPQDNEPSQSHTAIKACNLHGHRQLLHWRQDR